MKGTSVYIRNMCIKQHCNPKVRDFATAFRVRKLFGTSIIINIIIKTVKNE